MPAAELRLERAAERPLRLGGRGPRTRPRARSRLRRGAQRGLAGRAGLAHDGCRFLRRRPREGGAACREPRRRSRVDRRGRARARAGAATRSISSQSSTSSSRTRSWRRPCAWPPTRWRRAARSSCSATTRPTSRTATAARRDVVRPLHAGGRRRAARRPRRRAGREGRVAPSRSRTARPSAVDALRPRPPAALRPVYPPRMRRALLPGRKLQTPTSGIVLVAAMAVGGAPRGERAEEPAASSFSVRPIFRRRRVLSTPGRCPRRSHPSCAGSGRSVAAPKL